jgi:hypothetical protein
MELLVSFWPGLVVFLVPLLLLPARFKFDHPITAEASLTLLSSGAASLARLSGLIGLPSLVDLAGPDVLVDLTGPAGLGGHAGLAGTICHWRLPG